MDSSKNSGTCVLLRLNTLWKVNAYARSGFDSARLAPNGIRCVMLCTLDMNFSMDPPGTPGAKNA